MRIGDVFLRVLGEYNQFHAEVQKEGAKAGGSMGSQLLAGIKKSFTGANIGKGLVQGLGFAGAFGAANLASNAIGTLNDLIGDSIKAFNEDQVSIQKLTTALRANVPGWDGQTAAIERVLKARMDLGFSDDEQRDSLAKLTAATHDVNEALAIQRTAMDLARFKGISLADASDALIKVEAGQYRALKALGIVLKEGATQTDALAAVQKVATGQAEDYAETNEGKLLISQVKVNDAMESFGRVIAPIQADLMTQLADRASDAAAAFDVLTTAIEEADKVSGGLTTRWADMAASGFRPDKVLEFGETIAKVIDPRLPAAADRAWSDFLANFGIGTSDATDAIEDGLLPAMADIVPAGDQVNDALANSGYYAKDAAGNIALVGSAAKKARSAVGTATKSIAASWKDVRDKIVGYANELISDAFEPIMAYDDLVAANAEAAAQRKILATKATTTEQKEAAREARAALNQTMQDTATQLVILAEAGQTGSAAFKTGLANLKTFAAGTKGQVKADLEAAIAEIEKLQRTAGKDIPPITLHIRVPTPVVTYTSTGPHIINAGWRIYDQGGRPAVGEPALIGRGRYQEMFVPDVPGTIIPHTQTEAMKGAGAWGDINVGPITITGVGSDVSAAAARRFTQQIADGMAEALREQTARVGR